MVVEEVHREQEHGCQEGFFAMHDGGNVEYPTRKEARGHMWEGQHQTASTDDGDTPEHCPVVELLEVSPAVKAGLLSLADKPLEHAPAVSQIFPVGYQ